MTKIPVNDEYKPESYNFFSTLSKLGDDGWVLTELSSSVIDGIRRIERSFGFDTGFKDVCNRAKLINGLGVVSSGYEVVYVCTNTVKVVWDNATDLIFCRNRLDAFAALFGEASAVCGAIKFFHTVQAVKLHHIIDGVNITKYSTGLIACVLRVYSARRWIKTQKPKDSSELAKKAFNARIAAKKASYWSNGSLGLLYGSLIVGKRIKMSPYIFVVLGIASCSSFIFMHFKNAKADHEEALLAYSKIASAA